MPIGVAKLASLILVGLLYLPTQLANANAAAIYAATTNGVFKSTDSGATWNLANAGLTGISVFSLAIDPSNDETVYAGTFGNGVFKSTDGGQSWNAASSGLDDAIILSLAIDPGAPHTIYAGTATSSFFPGSGVFKSIDGGNSWAVSNTGLPGAIINVLRVAPSNPAIVFAGTSFDGVFKSTNGGHSWAAANAGIAPASIEDLAVDPANPATLYAGIGGCSFSCFFPAGVFKSIDGGASWTAVNAGISDLQIASLAVDPSNADILYAGTHLNGVFKSIDAGSSWGVANPAFLTTSFAIEHLPVIIDPVHPEIVYVGTARGVFKSTDSGMNWSGANGGFPAKTGVFALAIAGMGCTPVVITGASASPGTLWPPDHKMVNVTVSYTATSSCPVTCKLRIESNEPDTVDTSSDWFILDAHHVQLRAEREGKDDGRIYNIAVTCSSSAGNSSTQNATVNVPHDER